MQIRAATRQDEPIIRTIIFQALEENKIQPDLDGRDSDLRNIEQNYFWFDGLCIVAERDGQVVGVLAGRRSQNEDEVLEICRLCVTPGARQRGAAHLLVRTMLFFAGNMQYKTVTLGGTGLSADLKFIDAHILKRLGFSESVTGHWQISMLKNSKNKAP